VRRQDSGPPAINSDGLAASRSLGGEGEKQRGHGDLIGAASVELG
jgi:hypothetical protein